ncbi:IPIL1 protein, partial [Rhynochetos jubatus]|nr:IPIL1 protein [Rhynochetos jubatus]
AWHIHKNFISYCLLVFLQSPPGHTFSLELNTTGQLPARHFRVRVVLECLCSRKQLLGDILCFLHDSDNRLPRDENSNLLHTLCTCSYLDVEKVTSWVQLMVQSAWLLLPQSRYCQLTVLPSSKSCKFQLTTTSKMNICMEMMFAVQQGSSTVVLSRQ